jgi:ABC-type antimicrobial peptide transport system permease subunit
MIRICGLYRGEILYWTGLTGLIGSIVISVSGRNREIAIPLAEGKKVKKILKILSD